MVDRIFKEGYIMANNNPMENSIVIPITFGLFIVTNQNGTKSS